MTDPRIPARTEGEGETLDMPEGMAPFIQGQILGERYGLNQPFIVQYWKWISNLVVGDFGQSFEWNQSVWELIKSRIPLTFMLSMRFMVAHRQRDPRNRQYAYNRPYGRLVWGTSLAKSERSMGARRSGRSVK